LSWITERQKAQEADVEAKQLADTFLEQVTHVRPTPDNDGARKKKRAVHFDATTTAGAVLRMSLCGLPGYDVDGDITKVTCVKCLARWKAQQASPANDAPGPRKPSKREKKELSAHGFVMAVCEAFRAIFAKKAPNTPRLDGNAWSGTCKGGEQRKCSNSSRCQICEWEEKAKAAYAISPWDDRPGEPRPGEGWKSLVAALEDYKRYVAHDRSQPSAQAGISARLASGEVGKQQSAKDIDGVMRWYMRVHPVEMALRAAFVVGGSKLTPERSVDVLLACTGACPTRKDGTAPTMDERYEQQASALGLYVGDVRAIVKHGRDEVEEYLLGRKLIQRQVRKRDRPAGSAVHIADEGREAVLSGCG
jgi:hypothetical protein